MPKVVIYTFFLIITIAYYFSSPDYLDTDSISFLIGIAVFSIVLFFLKKENNLFLKKQFLKHSTLVIFGFSVVHFQYHIDFLLGYINRLNPYIWVDNHIVVRALSLSVTGLISFFIGYLIYKKKINKIRFGKIVYERVQSTKILSYFAAILLAGYFYFANPLYLIGYYGSEELGTIASYIILLFQVVIFAVLIQNARNFKILEVKFSNFLSYVKSNSLLINILIGVYLISVMISGDRAPLIFFTIAYFGNYLFVTKNKLNIYKTLSFLILGAIFITVLGKVRSLDRTKSFSNRFSESLEMESRFETKSILPLTQELATSIRALHHTTSFVPIKHDYLYGRFQFQQVMSIIPFGNTFVNLFFDDNSYKYGGSASFVTWINRGDNPTSGDGSSVIADFYFDFGLLGVIVGMFIFGYTMRFAEISMYSPYMPTLFSHAFLIGFLSSAVYISRSTYLIELKAVFWIFFVLMLNEKIINRK